MRSRSRVLVRLAFLSAAAIGVLGLAACSESSSPDGGDKDALAGNHEGEHSDAHGAHGAHGAHVHEAPHGGTLVILSEEFAHVEFVLDPEAATLTAYVLGAHAATPVRVAQPTLELRIGSGESETTLALAAVANALTGETSGDTSEFRVQDESLRNVVGFDGVLLEITARGETFRDVTVHIH